MEFKQENGIYVPVKKEVPKPFKKKDDTEPDSWNCKHCGYFYDKTVEPPREEYTIGSLCDNIPHIICPSCKQCMGCIGSKV